MSNIEQFVNRFAERDWQGDVRAFHEAMGQTVGEWPHVRDAELRARLIAEEVAETIAALGFDVVIGLGTPTTPTSNGRSIVDITRPAAPSLVEVADGIADAIYVLLGTAVAAGIDMDGIWREVQRSNMDKTTGPVREDGKRLKPEGWEPPAIAEELGQQFVAAAVRMGIPFERVDDHTTRLVFPDESGCAFGCCPQEAAS